MLPNEFVTLNTIVKEFNTGKNVALFGENKYLLLQGSRVKGYSLWIFEGKIGEGRAYQSLVPCANKKDIIAALDLMDRLSLSTMAKANAARYITI